jgi:HD-GYP domain-containing protein (c-di-GMP phosphodiesterase class II)
LASPELHSIAPYILTHHERWDGKGYPKGIQGEDIPLLARILSIVDAYDAMTQDRVYRTGMPREDAIKELRRCSGSQFDPSLVDLFITHVLYE